MHVPATHKAKGLELYCRDWIHRVKYRPPIFQYQMTNGRLKIESSQGEENKNLSQAATNVCDQYINVVSLR